jgi:hypothetical protein
MKPNPSPALSLGRVRFEDQQPPASHLRPHRSPPYCRSRPCRSEKPDHRFSSMELDRRRRWPSDPVFHQEQPPPPQLSKPRQYHLHAPSLTRDGHHQRRARPASAPTARETCAPTAATSSARLAAAATSAARPTTPCRRCARRHPKTRRAPSPAPDR